MSRSRASSNQHGDVKKTCVTDVPGIERLVRAQEVVNREYGGYYASIVARQMTMG